jgi:hypothetical protein
LDKWRKLAKKLAGKKIIKISQIKGHNISNSRAVGLTKKLSLKW